MVIIFITSSPLYSALVYGTQTVSSQQLVPGDALTGLNCSYLQFLLVLGGFAFTMVLSK